jgi:4-amino-4-deoxychorismate lyase
MQFVTLDHNLKPITLDRTWYKQRSFLYGDAHFTTAKVESGKIALIEPHLARLQMASQRLGFNLFDYTALQALLERHVKGIGQGMIKIQIDRGYGVRGYGQLKECRPLIHVWTSAVKLSLAEVAQLVCLNTKLGHNQQLAGLKHCNRLEQILIAQELEQKGATDGLVSDHLGNLVESSKANVFWLEGSNWYTADLSLCGIAGVMRELILQNIKVTKVRKNMDDIINHCDAMFLSNSLIEVQPVESIERKTLDLAPSIEIKQMISQLS